MVTARSLWKLPAVFIVLLSVKSHPWHRRSLWRLASVVQTPSLTRHKPVVTIPSLGSQEAPITHPRDGTRRLRAAGDGWFQELALAAKWGPFTSGELGQVTVIVGPGPREMKQQTPAPGLAPPTPPDTSFKPILHGESSSGLQNDRFTGAARRCSEARTVCGS